MNWGIWCSIGFFKRLGVFFFLSLCFLTAAPLQSASLPDYTQLPSISTNLSAPTAVAVGPGGDVYVAESRNYRVQIFSPDGEYRSSLQGLNTPVSLAVGSGGELFVGNAGSGAVEVFDSTLKRISALGKGNGEFMRPTAIAVGSSGTVYVADGDANLIKVYKSDHTFSFSFGSAGMANGQFLKPVAIAINEAAGELVVSDLSMRLSMSGETSGRVQVFSLEGTFKRSFETRGAGDKSYIRPLGIAIDSLDRIYVSDAFQNVIVVYSSGGDYLGMLHDASQPLRNILGLAYAPASSQLYAVSLKTASVGLYSIDTTESVGADDSDDAQTQEETANTESESTTEAETQEGVAVPSISTATPEETLDAGDTTSGTTGDIPNIDDPILSGADTAVFTVQSTSCADKNMAPDERCISYAVLPAIAANLAAPTSVAVGQDEKIYVTEPPHARMQIFNAGGNHQQTLSGLNAPVSVAVNAEGLIFVGNAGNGSVEVYNNNLQRIGVLGQGDNEFMRPSAIAVDLDGNSYVVDGDANLVKVYKPDFSFDFSFGGAGVATGEFLKPVAIAINENANEIIVSDLAMKVSMVGEASGRVQIFTRGGIFKRHFETRSPGDKAYIRPLGVAVDKANLIYVSDAFQNLVVVYSSHGRYLGAIESEFRPLRNPLGMVYVPGSSRLLVASLKSSTIEGYRIDTNYAAVEAALEAEEATADDATAGTSEDAEEVAGVSADGATETISHTVAASVTGSGTITPAGDVTADAGVELAFSFSAVAGHHIDDVKVDGESIGAVSSYSFTGLNADHTITAEFIADDLPLNRVTRGEVGVNHEWKQVTLNQTYTDPILVAKSASLNDEAPAVVRVRNVTSSGFELRIQEWDYLDGIHGEEQVSYIVMERGSHTLADGTRIEAGQFETHEAAGTGAVSFDQTFSATPVVLTGIASANDMKAVTGRIGNLRVSGFDYRLQEQEANTGVHGVESVSYIAWEPSSGIKDGVRFEVGKTSGVVSHSFQPIYFNGAYSTAPLFIADIQSAYEMDVANLRWQGKNSVGVSVQVDEEQSLDDEIEHTTEVVGYIVIDTGPSPP